MEEYATKVETQEEAKSEQPKTVSEEPITSIQKNADNQTPFTHKIGRTVRTGVFCANCGSEVHEETCKYCGYSCGSSPSLGEKVCASISRINTILIKDSFWGSVWAWIRQKLNTRSWYNNPFWVAVVGSMIIIAGQLAATYLTIYTSPGSSDFSVSVDKIYFDYYKDSMNDPIMIPADFVNNTTKVNQYRLYQNILRALLNNTHPDSISQIITINDLHHTLKPYQHLVSVNVSYNSNDIESVSLDSREGIPPFKTNMTIDFTNKLEAGTYPITIQALGGDGKTRSSQCYLRIIDYKVYEMQQGLKQFNQQTEAIKANESNTRSPGASAYASPVKEVTAL